MRDNFRQCYHVVTGEVSKPQAVWRHARQREIFSADYVQKLVSKPQAVWRHARPAIDNQRGIQAALKRFQNRKRYGGMRDKVISCEYTVTVRFQNRKRYGGMRDDGFENRIGEIGLAFQNRKRYGGMRDRRQTVLRV